VKTVPLAEWPEFLAGRAARLRFSLGAFAGRMKPATLDVERRHHFESHLIRLLLQGHVDVEFGGNRQRLEAGDLLWIAPGVDWMERFDPNFTPPVFLRFRLEVMADGEPVTVEKDHRIFRSLTHARIPLENLVGELSSPGRFAEPLLQGLLLCLVTELARHEATEHDPMAYERRVLSREEIAVLREYFTANLQNTPTPMDLAKRVGLSLDYFSRVFHQTFQVSPRQWLLHERIRLAMDAIVDTDLPIKEIAETYGFCDVFYFSRQYKRHTGVPPAQYRRDARTAEGGSR